MSTNASSAITPTATHSSLMRSYGAYGPFQGCVSSFGPSRLMPAPLSTSVAVCPRAAPRLGRAAFVLELKRRDDAVAPHEEHVSTDEQHDRQRQQKYVVAVHLAEIREVEERAYADRVHRVLRLCGDPLRVEVLLRDVAGQRARYGDEEDNRAGDPHAAAASAPCGHPVLAPEVNDHHKEEQLHAPEVDAVEEMPDAGVVPPGGTLQGEDRAGGDDHDQ